MPLGSKTAKSVIDAMKSIFSRHGIPVEHSDNMPFTSFEFKQFAAHYRFNLTSTSTSHPNSNGKAEKGVQIVKGMLTKCYEAREDPMLALLNYSSTPLSCGKSPAELLMNRQLRNRLQVFPGTNKVTLEKFRKVKASQKQYYDRSKRSLGPLVAGQTVSLFDTRTNKFNQKGIVLNEHSHRSYMVRTEEGMCSRRNRAHLRVTSEDFNPDLESDETTSSSDHPVCPTSTCNEQNLIDGSPTISGPTAVSMSGDETLQRSFGSPSSLVDRPKRNRNPHKRLIEE